VAGRSPAAVGGMSEVATLMRGTLAASEVAGPRHVALPGRRASW
jgi:hypothetical protein